MKKTTKKPTTKRGKGNPAGPPVRGRRGHSSIDQQKGFTEWLERQLLEEPRPTYEEIVERAKATGYYASRSALWRFGIKFEAMRIEMKRLIDQARVLASEDPEHVLEVEKALSQLATVKMFEQLLAAGDRELGKDELALVFAHSKLQASSAARERTRLAHTRGYKHAARKIRAEMEKLLAKDPALAKKVLATIDRAAKEVAQ